MGVAQPILGWGMAVLDGPLWFVREGSSVRRHAGGFGFGVGGRGVLFWSAVELSFRLSAHQSAFSCASKTAGG